ncbi:MAG: LysR family transcriptional regulator [Pseudomonadota bacterium]|nr:LysR family transcriptional regulator [Pseudomonadota bacterium]
MDWDKLRIFHAVADIGSLTHAGVKLRLSQSAVSRQIRNLEDHLNVILFHRHARGLILTEQGELLFEATRQMSKRLDAASARIKDSKDGVSGELRVTTTTGFGTLWLAPRLGRLYEKYPKLRINLMLEERVLDLPMREADVAIRMKEPSQADLIRRRLMQISIKFFAHPNYVNQYGYPQSSEEMSSHRLICHSPDSPQVSAGARWVEQFVSANDSSMMMVNNYYGILQAVLHGFGIGALPDYLVLDFPELVPILPGSVSDSFPVFLAYPEELRHSKRVNAFRDFVIKEIVEDRKKRDSVS